MRIISIWFYLTLPSPACLLRLGFDAAASNFDTSPVRQTPIIFR